METEKLKIEYVKLSEIKPYKNNAKLHPKEQIDQIKKSIKEFGNIDPIGVWHGEIVEGHGRYIAAKQLKLDEVPIIRLDSLTDEERKAYALVHNKLTMNTDFDFDLLDSELDEILDIDMSEFGFELDEEEEAQEIEEDEVPEPPTEPKAKLGDLYILGNHRLICGDSTDVAIIDRLMDGAKADLVFTDPPYGMKKESEGVLNDNLNYDDLLDFNRQWIPLTFGALKDNGSWYCWGIDEPLMDIYSEILKPMQKANKITFRNLITWDKGNGQGQLSEDFRMYLIADEKCLFVMVGVQGFSNNADNYFEAWEPIRSYLKQERDRMGWSNADMKKMCGHSPTSGCHWFDKSQWMMPTEEEYKTWQHHAKGEGFKKEYEEIKKEYYSTRAYFDNTHDNQNNVWHFDRAGKDEREHTGGHATPKPIALCSRAIKSSSREGEIVLDVFGGSGSTLIACEQLNRKCYMAELDPKYVSVILQRYINFKGSDEDVFLIRDGKKIPYSEVLLQTDSADDSEELPF